MEYLLDYIEAQAFAADVIFWIDAVENLKYFFLLFWLNPNAVVFHSIDRTVALGPAGDSYPPLSAGGEIFKGVGKQVGNDPLDLVFIH